MDLNWALVAERQVGNDALVIGLIQFNRLAELPATLWTLA